MVVYGHRKRRNNERMRNFNVHSFFCCEEFRVFFVLMKLKECVSERERAKKVKNCKQDFSIGTNIQLQIHIHTQARRRGMRLIKIHRYSNLSPLCAICIDGKGERGSFPRYVEAIFHFSLPVDFFFHFIFTPFAIEKYRGTENISHIREFSVIIVIPRRIQQKRVF